MKSIKILIMLLCFTFMGSGCRHDHHHEEKLPKESKSASQTDTIGNKK